MLLIIVAVAILSYSSLVYWAEREAAGWTFLEAFWWGLMTVTTVGYDLNPQTFLGKLIGKS